MEFSWLMFWVTVVWKIMEALTSIKESVFSLGQMEADGVKIIFHGKKRWQHLPMSFLNNWAAGLGDLLIWPLFNGLVVAHAEGMSSWTFNVLVIAGFGTSYFFHRAWWGHNENLGHIFYVWTASKNACLSDLTRAGWLHFLFMVAQVALVLAYIITPLPSLVVLIASCLLMAFVMIQQAQAVLVQNGSTLKAMITATAQIGAVVVIALVKMA